MLSGPVLVLVGLKQEDFVIMLYDLKSDLQRKRRALSDGFSLWVN